MYKIVANSDLLILMTLLFPNRGKNHTTCRQKNAT